MRYTAAWKAALFFQARLQISKLRLLVLLGAAAAISIVGCQSQGPLPPDSPPAPPPPLSVTFAIRYEPAGETRLDNIRYVNAVFTIVGGTSANNATVEFIGPGGSPYESRTALLRDTPFEEQQLEFPLSVAGTLIDTAQLTGTWKVPLFIDGQMLAEPVFQLNP